MGLPAHAEALSQALQTRRAAVQARHRADQARLVPHLRGLARKLLPEADPIALAQVGEVLADPTLVLVLDDLERSAEAERHRLREVAVLDQLRNPTRRAAALDRRHADALARIATHQSELARLDTEAFRWLRERRGQRRLAPTRTERVLRALTLTHLREQRAEAALRESLGNAGWGSAVEAFDRAEKGLARAEAEAEHVSHTRAMLTDLVQEHADLVERVQTEPARRLRALQAAVESRLVLADLAEVARRAPAELQPAVAEAHAVETRLRGWQDLVLALDAAITEVEALGVEAWTTADPDATAARLHEYTQLPEAADRVVDVLAAFHDFEGWQTALRSSGAAPCWAQLAGPHAECLPTDLLRRLVPRLLTRTVGGDKALARR